MAVRRRQSDRSWTNSRNRTSARNCTDDRHRTARTRARALHGILDGIRHPATHLAEKFIGNFGELHTSDSSLFIRPFETAMPLDPSLFVQIGNEFYVLLPLPAFDLGEHKTMFRQIEHHAAITRLYFNIE